MACMFFQFSRQDSDALKEKEKAAFAKLCATHRRLVVDSGRINTKSEGGFKTCAAFLDVLGSTAGVLELDPTPRSYRSAFTVNYRALFPDRARHYRVDILEASVEQYAAIWVNGDKFEFSAEAMRRAELLQNSWSEMGQFLESCNGASREPSKAELRRVLMSLDFAWASFEEVYISELIGIEEKARLLIVQAIEHERCLEKLELQHGKGDEVNKLAEYQEIQRRLMGIFARLNSVANYRRKGRDDFNVEVLFHAVAILRNSRTEGKVLKDTEARSVARTLATDVVESFGAVRAYLRQVVHCLERVDPHLCNNPGLVQRLVDLEESWEVGARYVQHNGLLDSVCDLVSMIRTAERLVPALTAMYEECDVELFMVLPRILWLRFLATPGEQLDLLKELLPHRFVESSGDNNSTPGLTSTSSWHPDLQRFIEKFRSTIQLLVETEMPGQLSLDATQTLAWEIVLKRAVVGSRDHEKRGDGRPQGLSVEAEIAVEDLVHDLEKWSMEVQRHCPGDWNQCAAILVQCLTGSRQPRDEADFHV